MRAEVPIGCVPEHETRCLERVYAAGRSGSLVLDGQHGFRYRTAAPGHLVVDVAWGLPASSLTDGLPAA
ncbi:MAG: hypothetical protein SGI84_00995 [Gemmatimonadota bacterium]|nr:hypothetical protein [Gemmatimonadota bacterium]